MLPSLIAAGDFDPIQIAIVVLFLFGGVLKWVWENWQAKREMDTASKPADPAEQRLRDEAWRRQTGQPPRAPPAAQGGDSWAELRKAWNELKDAARQKQEPASPPVAVPPPLQPPPLRQPSVPPTPASPPYQASGARRGSVRATLTNAEQQHAAARAERQPAAVMQQPVPSAAPAVVEQRPPSLFMVALQNLRGNPALMRQAIVMHEVLGPPKALQSSNDSAI